MTGDPWRPADESGAAPAPQGSYGDGAAWDAAQQQEYPQPYQPQAYPQQQPAAWTAAAEPPEPRPWSAPASGYPAEPQGWHTPASGYPADPQPTQVVPPAPAAGGYGQQRWPAAPYPPDRQPTQPAPSWPGAGYDQQPTQPAYQAPQTPPQAAPPQPQQPVQQPSSRLAQNWGTPAPSAFAAPAPPAPPAGGYQPTSVIPPLPGGRYGEEDEDARPHGGGRGPAGSDKLPRIVREHPTEVGLGAAVVVASLLIVGILSLGGNGGPAAAQAADSHPADTRAATQGADSSASPSGQVVVVPADTPGSPSPSPSASASMLAPGGTGQLVNAASGLCLTTSDPSFGQGSTIVLAACAQAPTQEWTDTGVAQLTQNNSAGCLDDYGLGTTAGTEVDLWACNGGANQQWTLLPDGTIVGRSSDLCVSPVADASAAGTQVVLEVCDGSAAQRWI